MAHSDFDVFMVSWDLTLRADGYADNTLLAYRNAVRNLADWLAEHHPTIGPVELGRDHVRGWLAHIRKTRSMSTARGWFAGVRHFCRWLQAEGETDRDATAGIKTPAPGDPKTPVLDLDDFRALLSSCVGGDFIARRDAAILMVLLDGGLRLSELAGLRVTDVDLRDRMVFVEGKASRRSGPRHRAVPIGVKAARMIDRYLRKRRSHPFADSPALWLGDRGRATLSADGIDAMLKRRAAAAGIEGLHPHMFRHSWAHAFRAAGGSEGDLMLLGGWRSRAMLDRYGKSAAADRAAEAYRRLSLGDRL
ncbi:MAG TPA: tyrosine-type recombinase/integrase [Actinomycetes bacterium]|jgi:site-specific recombinase XerD|nr:tyrosine-type recombinase/integrase [Actinomycetes bacterium]